MKNIRSTPLLAFLCAAMACATKVLPTEPKSPGITSDTDANTTNSPDHPPMPSGLRERGILRISDADPALAVQEAQVTMRLLTAQHGAWYVAEDGAELRSGERFKVEVELRAQECISLLYRTSDGTAAVLYPMGDEPACLGAGTHQLPPPVSSYGHILTLDAQVGQEVLFLIVSDRPLTASDSELGQLVADTREGRSHDLVTPNTHAGANVGTKPPSRSTRMDQRKRTNNRVKQALRSRGNVGLRRDGSSIDAKLGDDGIAVLMLTFEHVAG